jgi:hypothetical protein
MGDADALGGQARRREEGAGGREGRDRRQKREAPHSFFIPSLDMS